MRSDDAVAAAAIVLGTALALTTTVLVLPSRSSDPWPSRSAVLVTPVPLVYRGAVRAPAELMVGPEGEHSGWAPPPPLRMR
jgi:hypothetical protein